jgi:hypothetical protein
MTRLEWLTKTCQTAWDELQTMEKATIPFRNVWYEKKVALEKEQALESARAEVKKEQNGNA